MYYNQESIDLFLAWYDSQSVCTANVQYLQQIFVFASISYVQSFKLNEVNHV